MNVTWEQQASNPGLSPIYVVQILVFYYHHYSGDDNICDKIVYMYLFTGAIMPGYRISYLMLFCIWVCGIRTETPNVVVSIYNKENGTDLSSTQVT